MDLHVQKSSFIFHRILSEWNTYAHYLQLGQELFAVRTGWDNIVASKRFSIVPDIDSSLPTFPLQYQYSSDFLTLFNRHALDLYATSRTGMRGDTAFTWSKHPKYSTMRRTQNLELCDDLRGNGNLYLKSTFCYMILLLLQTFPHNIICLNKILALITHRLFTNVVVKWKFVVKKTNMLFRKLNVFDASYSNVPELLYSLLKWSVFERYHARRQTKF